jgi:hypothetical protein
VVVESDADTLARPRRVLAADAAVVFAEGHADVFSPALGAAPLRSGSAIDSP